MRLLITRPAEDGERSAAALRARGHQVLLAPLLRIEPIADVDLGATDYAAILMSSANAARAIAPHPRMRDLMTRPVLAVGASTARAARTAGFLDVQSADGNARDLGRLAAARFSGSRAPLLYLTGDERARDLADDLPNVPVRTVVVYRAVKIAALPPNVRDALLAGNLDGVLHFSLRSAEAFVACTKAAGLLDKALALFHYCLSPRVAGALAGAADIRIAARPDEAALLDLVATR
ncbi:MAG TPA: uroporphyrinogen-III synthase [Xanthobacteraceae bacterium]|nr:uroporphyrinogen-III synthase [Xanthobacteraceae bacterium]